MTNAPETVKGMRDFLPEEKILRDEVINKIKTVFEIYGFSPLETPALESKELLTGKGQYGDEALKLIYDFKDKAGREIGLRYESPQKGRYREFYQCDIDTIGAAGSLADAELLACANDALLVIGLNKFTFRINSRKLMNEILKSAGIEESKISKTLRTLDKADKISEQNIAKELRTFLSESAVFSVLETMKLKGEWNRISQKLKASTETKKEIDEFLEYLSNLGVRNYVFDLSLARGLDYYTGFVFEIDAGVGISVGSGGRYDKLIEVYSGENTPATGISLGFERYS